MNNLTEKQAEATERAYQEAHKEWLANSDEESNISRYFFYAGAQLGIEIAADIYKEPANAK